MDVLSALLGCSLYMDDNLVRAIVESTSQSNPLFVQNVALDSTPPEEPPITVAQAVAQAEAIAKHGGRPVLGLMQIPAVWLTGFGRSLQDAFDPCINVTIGTAMLSNFAYECAKASGAKDKTSVRPCITRKYATAAGALDFEIVTNLELQIQRPKDRETPNAPIYRGSWATWGSDAILVTLEGAK